MSLLTMVCVLTVFQVESTFRGIQWGVAINCVPAKTLHNTYLLQTNISISSICNPFMMHTPSRNVFVVVWYMKVNNLYDVKVNYNPVYCRLHM